MINSKAGIWIAAAIVAVMSLCHASASDDVPTASQRRAAWLKKVGGFCEGETKGKHFLFVNCAEIDGAVFDNVIEQMRQVCGIAIRHQRESLTNDSFVYAKGMLRKENNAGAVVVFYKGDANAPIEALYPMDKVCAINVTPLRHDNSKVFNDRITAVACRSIAYLAGGAMPFGVDGCMKNIFGVRGIDSLKSKLMHPMSGQLVRSSASDFDFALWKRGTYIAACQEGWAPPPTNDYQKAVWNQVHQIPDKPITIEFDPKKDK